MYYKISLELSVEPEVRTNNGKELVISSLFNEFMAVLEKMETKERRTREWLTIEAGAAIGEGSGMTSADSAEELSLPMRDGADSMGTED